MANAKQENKGKRSFGPLLWGLIYMVNLGVYLLYLIFFVHTIPAPATPASLAEQPYFEGCTILDTTVMEADNGYYNYDPDFVLFEDEAGNRKITEIRYNYFLPRYRIKESSTVTVSDGNSDTHDFSFFLGKNTVTVHDQSSFDVNRYASFGFQINSSHVLGAFVAVGIFMTMIESFFVIWLEKIRKAK